MENTKNILKKEEGQHKKRRNPIIVMFEYTGFGLTSLFSAYLIHCYLKSDRGMQCFAEEKLETPVVEDAPGSVDMEK